MSINPPNVNPSNQEVVRRRTFAIISHPDAGKTTLTEKFLLYGGAIQLAGQVRAKGEADELVLTSCKWRKTEEYQCQLLQCLLISIAIDTT